MIRLLGDDDLQAVKALSDAAGWNQTEADWRLLLHLQPQGCFGFEAEGNIVSTATLVCYGETLAWLGMVLTAEPFRGRGYARELLHAALKLADSRNVPTVKLDATSMGKPLYESLGFRSEQAVERWHRQGPEREVHGDLAFTPKLAALDFDAFGADRSRLLQHLARTGSGFECDGGYAITRGGERAAYIGPCVANSPAIARKLVSSVLGGTQYWDILENSQSVQALAHELGFQRSRTLTRMCRGQRLPAGNDATVAAIAGFEWG